MARLEPLERPRHPFAVDPPREDVARARWVRPTLVGEVVYRQFTRGAGRLRHTAWRGLRTDKSPEEVIAPRYEPRPSPTIPDSTSNTGAKRASATTAPTSAPPTKSRSVAGQRILVQVESRQLTLSNLDKPLYPGFTKGEVINYYSHIAPALPPCRLVLIRGYRSPGSLLVYADLPRLTERDKHMINSHLIGILSPERAQR